MDIIDRVPKGESGSAIIYRVRSEAGQNCGTMLWEANSTKGWNNRWLENYGATSVLPTR